MTQKQKEKSAKEHYQMYLRSEWKNIFQAYGKPSMKKIEAFEYCENLCKKHDGHGLKIITRNTDKFTAGFEYKENGIPMFMYITPSYDVEIEVGND